VHHSLQACSYAARTINDDGMGSMLGSGAVMKLGPA
jgi:hypothetical protein